MATFAETTASFWKTLIITLFLEKNANFFDENWQKSQKLVTPGHWG
jgi:3-oxoacyl-ACP reductase-like protein